MTKLYTAVAIVLLAVGFGIGFTMKNPTLGANSTPTKFTNPIQMLQTLAVTGATTLSGAVSLSSTLGVTGTSTFTGAVVSDGGVIKSNVNSTSTTATSYTLIAADVCPSGKPYDTIVMVPNTGALTLTTMASSSLSACAPNAGEWFDMELFNATSAAAGAITLAAGTGIDLETASSSIVDGAPSLVIGAGNSATLRWLRKGAGANAQDFVLKLIRFADGD